MLMNSKTNNMFINPYLKSNYNYNNNKNKNN